METEDKQRSLGCVYPTMWGRPCVAFLPRPYYMFLIASTALLYVFLQWFGVHIFLNMFLSLAYFIMVFVYGLLRVRKDSFVFDILICKIFDCGTTQHFRARGGNIYYSSKF